MKKCIKVLIGLMAAVIISTTSNAEVVKANSTVSVEAGQVIDGSALTNEEQAEDNIFNVKKGVDFYQGGVKISKLSSNTINVFGYTFAYHDCDDVDLYMYVEKLVDGSWCSYKSFKYTDNNVSTLSKSISLKVDSGYYYRLRGYHRTYNDGRQESTTTATDGIYIG